jgi:light-regulated signal transduction histidine kinase (bacteriophytochrome)
LFNSFVQTVKDPNKEIWHQEYSIKKANGTYGTILAKGKLIRNSEGKVIRMVGAFSDITAQKDYEESLKQLNQQLRTSNQELEQFAYATSHDLQEPLRMVTSFLERLESKYADQLDEKGKRYIEFAVDGGKRMRRMIMDLLDYSRVGKRKGSIEKIELLDIVNEVKALNKKSIDESNAKIISEKLPTITAYRSPILQLFHNIISNAIKYRKADVDPIIEIKSKPKGKMIQFEISDNGIGIHADFYDKIFAVFQRLHGRNEYSGSGMGLAIVKKVISQAGGKIWIDSKVGEGTTFYFTIPKRIDESTKSNSEKN